MAELRKKTLVIWVLVLLIVLCGCSGNTGKSLEGKDILTQKVVEKDKIPVTVLVKYAFSIKTFEKEVEKKFPQLDLIQVGNYTDSLGIDEYERRLEHDDLTDIVMTWPLDVGTEYWSEKLLDLSGMDFSGRYNISMMNDISQDGSLYYLPGPAQVRGIVYNKTLFNEKGWEVPQDFNGFINLCEEIENSGMRSIQLGFENAEVLDTAFIGYSYGDCYSKPADTQWINQFNKGQGDFKEQFSSALTTFQTMIDKGIWKKEDLNIGYADREKMLFTRQCAMIEDSVLLARMGESYNGCTDEFALMPFFSPNSSTDWARLYMVCYIGVNKHLAEPQNKEKYDMVMEIMDYISTKEGQEALAGDTGAMYSSLNGTIPPDIPEIENLMPALSQGRYGVFQEFENAQKALRTGLKGMLEGTLKSEDVIKAVNEENKTTVTEEEDPVIGKATTDFTIIETGNYLTDAMREKCDADFSLFLDNGKDGRCNGKGVTSRFYEGKLTKSDALRVLPDLKHGEKGVLQKITMKGKDIINTLEHSIVVDNNVGGWFYYFSGLKVEYNPTETPGSRIKEIRLSNGEELDLEKQYSVAVMDGTVREKYVISTEETNILIKDLLQEAIKEDKEIAPSNDQRFVISNS